MKKLITLFVSAFIMLSCEVETVDTVQYPEMESFYNESLTLETVAPDSVQRFVSKVNTYTRATPSAKESPLFPQIVENVNNYTSNIISFSVTISGWDEMHIAL